MAPIAISAPSVLEESVRAPSKTATETTMKPNLALYVTGDHRLYQKEVPFPVAEADECIVHVKCTGICGSEIHFWKTGGIGDYRVTHDLVLGHESSGVILSVGAKVKNLKAGDRVSIEPGVPCSYCNQCTRGRYNLCQDVAFCGTPPSHGTLQRYIAHRATFLHKIPDSMSFAEAALVEPISVGLGGVQRSGLKLGQPTLVCGAGPIGLMAIALSKAAGAYPIVVTDISSNRLDWAKSLGADATVLSDMAWDGKRVAQEVVEVMGGVEPGLRPQVALECTGAQSSVYGAAYALEEGSVLMQIGNGKNEQMIPFQSLSMREIDVRFLFRYINTWPMVIRLLSAGKLPGVNDMITHTFPLERALEAFDIAADPTSGAVKVQIVDE